jgi:hypothetical protein
MEKLMAALAFVGARSKRLRPYMPFLSAIPVIVGAYGLYKRHKARQAMAPAAAR